MDVTPKGSLAPFGTVALVPSPRPAVDRSSNGRHRDRPSLGVSPTRVAGIPPFRPLYTYPVNSGTKYLLSSIAGAGNTLNAYRPVITSSRGVIPVLAAAGPTSELPLQTIAWQQAATAAFVKRGALKTRGGQLGLAISAASWAALLHMHHVAGRSAKVFERALAEDLGPSYRDAYVGVPLAPADLVLTRLQKAIPRPGRRSQYALRSNVEYGEFGARNRLDIWARPDLPLDRRAPVLLQIHGGAWIMGSKRGQAYPLMSHLAKQGWVCVAINYRLSPKSDWPASVVDIKRAIAWIRENISEMGVIPNSLQSREDQPAAI